MKSGILLFDYEEKNMNNNTPVMELKGIGEKTNSLFHKLHIDTIGDLIHFYPVDYEVFSEPVSIDQVPQGEICSVYATINSVPNEKKVRKLSILNVMISDYTGKMQLTFFNMPFLKKILRQGTDFIFRGIVQNRGTLKIMEQPRFFSVDDYRRQMNSLIPKYSLTKGLTHQLIRKSVKTALAGYEDSEEYYPETIVKRYDLLSEKEALETIHFPPDRSMVVKARKRLVFDEFFAFLYQLQQNRTITEGLENPYQMFETADTVRFLEQLPFPLTKAQKKAWQEIRNDLGNSTCMNRLIQGDVGSGKTIIAILALLMTAANGYQGAMMAPTEVLAIQHFETVHEYIQKHGICFRPVLLVGSMTAKEKKEAYCRIASGEANLIIGTHALIQDKVQYKNLALVVTDEQHRFGVNQRETLSEKGKNPHILVMSATPIPRTLAIILYGDLHISVIDELPAGRLPIKNCVVNASYRPKAYHFISDQVGKGHQVYVICPQVEQGEADDLENVIDYTEKLKTILPSDIRIAYLHGKMRPADKTRIMEEFSSHNIDVLVSTTVIEVGINVPNATVMMVENAERFGLAQLHQLRGRVGRGKEQSYCIFVSSQDNKETMERLQILNQTNDGFRIASEDLRLRGPGDMFGIRQSGEFAFRIGDIYSDAAVLKEASEAVNLIVSSDSRLERPEHARLSEQLMLRMGNQVDFRSI